ncbi:MAG: glycosyltransferase family 2 protein [Chloroflexia bacterium]|nr:glycosyltransferase family 2 protein [Chloroflexia bacterium]
MTYIVVLSWNFKDYTLGCLESVLQMRGPTAQVLLVDNASTDGTVPAVRQAFPQVEIQVNPEDLGFARGMNRGIKVALERGAEHVMLVSNDTILAEDTLEIMLQAMESDPQVGMVSPLIYYPDRERIWYAGAYRRRFFPGLVMPGYGQPDQPRYHVRREVDYATGCVLLLRADMLRQIGAFDPTFFMYYEDLDLCERARAAGWRILLASDAEIVHLGSASYGEYSTTKWTYMARYTPTFYRRYYRWPRLSATIYAAWVLLRESLRGNYKIVRPFLRGFWRGWKEAFRSP